MAITSTCGHHCGIRGNAEGTVTREGHCDCPECHDGTAPIILTRSDLLTVAPVQPMCERWYTRAGDHRPWDLQPPAPDVATETIGPGMIVSSDENGRRLP